jgi:hypothetical protein
MFCALILLVLFLYVYIIMSPSIHSEELNYRCSPNFIPVIKWRRIRWAGHVARMGEKRGAYRVLV